MRHGLLGTIESPLFAPQQMELDMVSIAAVVRPIAISNNVGVLEAWKPPKPKEPSSVVLESECARVHMSFLVAYNSALLTVCCHGPE